VVLAVIYINLYSPTSGSKEKKTYIHINMYNTYNYIYLRHLQECYVIMCNVISCNNIIKS